MCLAVPMRIVEVKGGEGFVESSGLRRKANFSLIKAPRIGEYVLLHAGFAIERVKEKEAQKTLRALKSMSF
ncbi:MAG: HypC/HybG/HupF family hydrogenase formation chaperone [Candidatus Omnitrophica bacterium]|nr:HypC/HybG/HupF family hydrogenase formation chaperone [Candidatus Omnitrophota bacterium]